MRWTSLDTSIALIAVLSAMSCALPGTWLVLRRHSMMGDALSHTALPGVVMAFLAAAWLQSSGVITASREGTVLQVLLMAGAVLVGVGTSWLTEWVQRLGRMDSGAALGVVFTSVFALGLLLVRLFADSVDIDPDCVLFGNIETAALKVIPGTVIPQGAVVNAGILILNLGLTIILFKELRIAAFDPGLATALGMPARAVHYGLMAATALTVVAAFRTVGSILVIGLLIVPGATALLLSHRLRRVVILSVLVAALGALLGHVVVRTVPGWIFPRLGFTSVRDAGTAGMMAVTSGVLFLLALFLAPQQGLISRAVHRARLALRIAGDDVLGVLYRLEEQGLDPAPMKPTRSVVSKLTGLGPWMMSLTLRRLQNRKLITQQGPEAIELTEQGCEAARSLIRAHCLWEAYMSRHFELPDDHLHETAHRVEHYIDDDIQGRLTDELDSPRRDPHGRRIPTGTETPGSAPAHGR